MQLTCHKYNSPYLSATRRRNIKRNSLTSGRPLVLKINMKVLFSFSQRSKNVLQALFSEIKKCFTSTLKTGKPNLTMMIINNFTHSFIFFSIIRTLRIAISVCRMQKFPRVLCKNKNNYCDKYTPLTFNLSSFKIPSIQRKDTENHFMG